VPVLETLAYRLAARCAILDIRHERRIKRRGILAAAGAVVAGIVTQKTAPVGATSGTGRQGNLVLGSNFGNTANSATALTLLAAGASTTATELFDVQANQNLSSGDTNIGALVGVGRRTGFGLFGTTSVSNGVLFPTGYPALNASVYGFVNPDTPGVAQIGVAGASD
jgi:hypothetical protein